MHTVSVVHSHGSYTVMIDALTASEARIIARQEALADGLLLYRVVVAGSHYGPLRDD
jgi:hypothetical protein